MTALALRVGIPEDIDLFSVDDVSQVDAPNVLSVRDNSANWSRQSQQWPGGLTQGQSEVRAIKTVINGLDSNINVGLLEYSTGGSSSDSDGGYVRQHIRPLTTANRSDERRVGKEGFSKGRSRGSPSHEKNKNK